MTQEIVLTYEILRSESTQSAPGEEQKINLYSAVINNDTRLKLKGHVVADMRIGERKVHAAQCIQLEHEYEKYMSR